MRIIRKVTALVLILAIAVTCLSGTTFAASETIEWDGVSALLAGKTYTVSSTLKVKRDVVVPGTTTLYIKSGGELLLYKGRTFTLNGLLKIGSGGIVTSTAELTVTRGGSIRNYGTFNSTVSGILSVKGKLINYENGEIKISSKFLTYTTASITNSGKFYVTKSSTATMSGTLVNSVTGDFYVQGTFSITLSGKMYSFGYVRINSGGRLSVSGLLDLRADSYYSSMGRLNKSTNGTIINNSKKSSYVKKMTIATLMNEKEVVSKGVDVSYAQGDIDWQKVASSGIDFAIVRAGRGDTNGNGCKVDDYFKQNVEGATANGLDVGVYFFSYATTVEEAKAEAEFLIRTIKGYKINYPIVLDMEEEIGTDVNVTEMIEAFFSIIIKEGYFPMFYSYKTWINQYLDMRILDNYALWLAEISDKPTYEGAYFIWQYTFKGTVDGINGEVDLNYSYRDFPSIFKANGLNNL